MGDIKRADFYDGPAHDYLGYWKGRDYEHAAERIAIDRLLTGRHFANAVDVGGGYGRITALLPKYADHVTLAEPSSRQLDIAARFLDKGIDRVQAQAERPAVRDRLDRAGDDDPRRRTTCPTRRPNWPRSPDPRPGGHRRHRGRQPRRTRRTACAGSAGAIPTEPVDIRSPENRHDDEIPFVNHNPTP